jgi:hypothetical protein
MFNMSSCMERVRWGDFSTQRFSQSEVERADDLPQLHELETV